MNKNKIQEATYVVGDPNAAVTLASTNKLKPVDKVVVDKNAAAKAGTTPLAEEDDVLEPEAVIAPQDNATIKYLSNVKDSKTGEVSKPFTIGAQKYQMVRGVTSDKQIVMAVYCHDEKDEMGNNVIHAVDHFEKTIAMPMLEKENRGISEVKEENEETYEGSKHFLVDTKTNKVRKFKTVEDLLSANKSENEVYMNAPKFKKYMTERLFGKRKKMNELDAEPTVGGEEDMSNKANKLMDIIDDNKSVQNAIKTIKTPDAQKEVIAAFANLIGVPTAGLSNLVGQIKDISKQPKTENVVMTKNELLESIKPKTVIKTIKVKDIK